MRRSVDEDEIREREREREEERHESRASVMTAYPDEQHQHALFCIFTTEQPSLYS
jgi:hypothetical protein